MNVMNGRKQKRWGVRTIVCLVISLLAVLTSNVQHHYTILTLVMLLGGFVGAAYCSVRGLTQQ